MNMEVTRNTIVTECGGKLFLQNQAMTGNDFCAKALIKTNFSWNTFENLTLSAMTHMLQRWSVTLIS